MAQQTAVEWLDRWFRDNPEATHEEGNKALQKAKQIEKEQIIKAYNQDLYGGLSGDKKFDDGEQYYNETYSQ